jgi:hypothetical protein
MLAVERDTKRNALAIEAFNDLLKNYGKRATIKDPLIGQAPSTQTQQRQLTGRNELPPSA